MNGRAEVGLPGLLAGVTVLLAALSPVLLPAEVVVLDRLEGPTVSVPSGLVVATALTLAGCGVLLARRWARLTRSRRPAGMMIGQAHALAWAGLAVVGWPLAFEEPSWFPYLGQAPWVLGHVSGWAATRHRPREVPAAVRPPAYSGEAVAWSGHARLSADVAAPLLVFMLLILGPPYAAMLDGGGSGGWFGLLAPLLVVLLLYNRQLRALWVTVTIGANGIRIRTGPFGQVLHRSWDQIGAVEALDEELPPDSLLWARRFARRYVLRAGPALRIRPPEPHRPAITVSVDHADQAAAIATRHHASRH